MAKEFKTRAGKVYFLKSRLTSKGNTTYYMTVKQDDDCLDAVPDGYEVFEKPNFGMLYVRKIKPSKFSEEELKILNQHLKSNKALHDYRLDTVGKTLKIYTSEKGEIDDLSQSLNKSLFANARFKQLLTKHLNFEERMRIIKKKDEYTFQRYCYRGSVDDWITIDGGTDLENLAKENIKHLGRQSYYDLNGFW